MFKYFKPLIIATFFLLLVNADLLAQTSIKLLETAIKQLQPFTCHFSQVYHDAFQEKTSSASGTFSFMQPGLMKWTYELPEEMLFIVGREKAWLYDPDLENVTIQPLKNVSGIRSLRFLSDNENISDHFKVTKPNKKLLDSFKGKEVIYLAPNKKNQALAELQLAFDSQENKILQFVLVDHNSNYRKISLTGIKIDNHLKETDFEFTVIDSMEVIEGFDN